MLPKQYAHGMMPVTPEVREDINKLNEHARRLNLAVMPATFASWQIRDIETDAVEMDSGLHKCNSFTRNFYNAMANTFTGQISGTTAEDFVYGEGSLWSRAIGISEADPFLWAAPQLEKYASNGTNGAYTGALSSISTGTYPPTPPPTKTSDAWYFAGIFLEDELLAEDFNSLELAAIYNGTSVGQLTHITPTNLAALNYNSETKTYTSYTKRIFQNNSGAPITIYSSAIAYNKSARPSTYSSYENRPIVFERSNFPEPVVLEAGKLIEVTYAVEFIYPEPEVAAPYSVEYTSTTVTEPTTVEFQTVDELKTWVGANKATLVTVKMSNTVVPDAEYSFENLFQDADFGTNLTITSVDMANWDATNLVSMAGICAALANLKTFVMPKKLTGCQTMQIAFLSCTNLENFVFPSDTVLNTITTWESCFEGCSLLKTVVFEGQDKPFGTAGTIKMFFQCAQINLYDFSAVNFETNTLAGMLAQASSSATTVTAWAKDQTNADLLNASSGKPANITFTVKP